MTNVLMKKIDEKNLHKKTSLEIESSALEKLFVLQGGFKTFTVFLSE